MGPKEWIEYTTKEGKQSVTHDAEIKTKEKAEKKGYTDVKQVLPTAEVTNNVNGDKIVLNENGTYLVNEGSAINPADQAYTTEGGATINVNQSAGNVSNKLIVVFKSISNYFVYFSKKNMSLQNNLRVVFCFYNTLNQTKWHKKQSRVSNVLMEN